MSFWYSDLSHEKPESVAQGKPPHWSDGIVDTGETIARFWGSMTNDISAFWFIDAPAWVAGGLVAVAIAFSALLASLFIAIKCGEWVARKTHRYVGIATGAVAWLYIGAIIYRAQHWAAVSLLSITG